MKFFEAGWSCIFVSDSGRISDLVVSRSTSTPHATGHIVVIFDFGPPHSCDYLLYKIQFECKHGILRRVKVHRRADKDSKSNTEEVTYSIEEKKRGMYFPHRPPLPQSPNKAAVAEAIEGCIC